MNYDTIIKQVAQNIGLPAVVVKRVYWAYWKSIRSMMSEIELLPDMTEAEFKAQRTSFNIPSLGKFSLQYDKFNFIRNKINNHDSNKENHSDE